MIYSLGLGNCLFVAFLLRSCIGTYGYNLPQLDTEQSTTYGIAASKNNPKFVIEYASDVGVQDYNGYPEDTSNTRNEASSPLDSWSVVWYIASFGALIIFFLVVSCSEWCCRRNVRSDCSRTNNPSSSTVADTPPPSYDQFAPPAYESLCYGRNGEKSEYDIYVVPVHALGPLMEANREESPPSYRTINNETVTPAFPPPVNTSPVATRFT